MLSFFRTLAKSKLVWIVLFVPVGLGLMTIGSVRQDLTGLFTSKDAVIQAGGRTFTSNDFKHDFDAYRRQQTQQGQQLTADDAVAAGIDQQMLQALAQRESLSALLDKLGIGPSAQQVFDEAISKVKAFQDPVTGKFDKRTYLEVLNQNQLTAAYFENEQRDELAYSQFAAAAAAGLMPPRLYGAFVGDYEFEAHDLSLFALKPDVLGKLPEPTDADLQKLLKDNATALTVPEMRQLTIVKFSAAALAPTLTPDPAEVKKRFDFRKDSLSQAEKRSLVQISAKDAAQASDIAAKLKAGQDPAAVAKAAGLQAPLVYTDTPKSGVADSKVGDGAFALADGAVSNPIQGNLGWAVIKVTGVTPAKVVSFEEAKGKIEDEVKTEAAATKAYDLVQKYEAAHDKGSTLPEAAKAAAVTPQTFAPATSGGLDENAKAVPDLTPHVLKEAFALAQGGETDVIQDSKGEYFAVRVDKVIPPTLPSMDKIKPRLIEAFQRRETSKRLTDKLNELAARVRKGESMDAVAQSVGSPVVHQSTTRSVAAQNRNVPPQVLQQIFTAKVGDVVVLATGGLVRIDAIRPPPAGIIAAAMAGGRQNLARSIFDETQQEARAWAKDQIKPKTNIALARQAIGASDKAVPATSSAAPAGKAQ